MTRLYSTEDPRGKPGCSQKVYDQRTGYHMCPNSVMVQGRLFCKIHDPAEVLARREAREKTYQDESRVDKENHDDMKKLAERLGCGQPHYHRAFSGRSGYVRRLVIDEADVLKLLPRLVRFETAL